VTKISKFFKGFLLCVCLATAISAILSGCIDKQSPAKTVELPKVAEAVTETPQPVPTSTETPLPSPTETIVPTEVVTPESLVTIEFKSENLEENIKAWQEGKMNYQLMEVTEEDWGKGLGLIVDEEEEVEINDLTRQYYFQGVYLGRETIKLNMSEEMANPENISLPDEYKNSPALKEDLLLTFNKMAESVIGGFPTGVDYTVVFVGMENGIVIPLSMGYEVEGKDIFNEEGLPTKKCPDITDGKFPDRNELSYLNTVLVNANTSFVNVKAGQTIAFEVAVLKKYGFTYNTNLVESRPNDVKLNFLSQLIGQFSNTLEMVNGNWKLLEVKNGDDLTWKQLFNMPYVTEYFVSRE